ncbi:MAG: hypothetical protein ACPG4T_05695 [Nannocystaceae bacterium]
MGEGRIDLSTILMQLRSEWGDLRNRREVVDEQFGQPQRLLPDTLDGFVASETASEGVDPRHSLNAAEFVGVAFSGGGIRSATVNLGILQGLQRHGILRHVDYLSTVSGGGFIGSSYSSLTATPVAKDIDAFPYEIGRGGCESPALVHLRNHSNYGLVNGFVDYARFFGVIFAGQLTNALLLLPIPVVFAFALAVVYGDFLREVTAAQMGVSLADSLVVTPWVAAGTGVLLVSSSVFLRIFGHLGRGRPLLRGRLYARRDSFERTVGLAIVATGGCLLFESLPLALAGLHHHTTSSGAGMASLTSMLTGTSALLGSVLSARVRSSPVVKQILGVVAGLLLGVLLPALVFFFVADWLVYSLGVGSQWFRTGLSDVPAYVWAGLGGWVALIALIDVNASGLHSWSRDRLSRAFLLTRGRRGGVTGNDDLRLSELSPPGSVAPLHILNTTLNLQASKDLGLRGRKSDVFSFTKHYIGSPSTGYSPTKLVEHVAPNITLGTAMAISGAALSANMGVLTTRSAVLLLTLLNIRQGIWVPNPKQLNARYKDRDYTKTGLLARILASKRYHADIGSLVREMFSRLDNRGTLVNVSDGGHFENTGGYELLRRRCKFVLLTDASQDGEMTHAGLATLILFARVDMGIEIEIDLENIQPDAEGKTRRHAAVGVIHYPETPEFTSQTGYLLYFKTSLTGDEDPVMGTYKQRHSAYPHEPTSDQFFDEAQFEVYRALGSHMVDSLVHAASERDDGMTFAEFRQWIQALRVQLAPCRSATAMAEVEFENGREDAGELHEAGTQQTAVGRLNKMAQMFQALDLDDPRNWQRPETIGWMNRFRRLARTPEIRAAFARDCSTWSEGFQVFCEQALGIVLSIRWQLAASQDAEAIGHLMPEASRRQLQRSMSTHPDHRSHAESVFLVGTVACEGVSVDLPEVCGARVLYERDTGRAVLEESGFADGFEGVYLAAKAYRNLKQELPDLLTQPSSEPMILAFSGPEEPASASPKPLTLEWNNLPAGVSDLLDFRSDG